MENNFFLGYFVMHIQTKATTTKRDRNVQAEKSGALKQPSGEFKANTKSLLFA